MVVKDKMLQAVRPGWSAKLYEARRRAGLTQSAFAAKLGVTQAAVTDWERGKNKPRSELWVAMAMILNIDVSEVMLSPLKQYLVQHVDYKYGNFLELNERMQYEIMLILYDEALAKANVVLDPAIFALLFHAIWLEATDRDNPPSQFEARLIEAIQEDVAQRVKEDRKAPMSSQKENKG